MKVEAATESIIVLDDIPANRKECDLTARRLLAPALMFIVLVSCGCTKYTAHIDTVPPSDVDIYFNDKYQGSTDKSGRASVSMLGDIPVLEVRRNGYQGVLRLQDLHSWDDKSKFGLYTSNVRSVKCKGNVFAMTYFVTFSVNNRTSRQSEAKLHYYDVAFDSANPPQGSDTVERSPKSGSHSHYDPYPAALHVGYDSHGKDFWGGTALMVDPNGSGLFLSLAGGGLLLQDMYEDAAEVTEAAFFERYGSSGSSIDIDPSGIAYSICFGYLGPGGGYGGLGYTRHQMSAKAKGSFTDSVGTLTASVDMEYIESALDVFGGFMMADPDRYGKMFIDFRLGSRMGGKAMLTSKIEGYTFESELDGWFHGMYWSLAIGRFL